MLGNSIGDDRLLALAERFVVAIESIASSLEGIDGSFKKAVNRIFPEPKKPTEARITRVPTEEDLLEEDLGRSDTRPISQWASFGSDDEPIGEREREFLKSQFTTVTKTQGRAATIQGSPEAPEDQA